MDDLTLARRLSVKDDEAGRLLIDLHYVAIYRFLHQLARRVHDAEDLAQQTMIRVLNGANRYDGRTSFRAWALGIAFHEYTRWRRRKPWLPLLNDQPAPSPDLIEAQALLNALKRLSPNEQAVFLLHHVEELPLAEIAAILRIPEGTVKSRLHAARIRLRTLLGEEEPSYVPETCRP